MEVVYGKPAADLNEDGTVNSTDLSELCSKWLHCNDPQNVDCNPVDSFEDTFDGSILDLRWTNDNSPSNPSGSEIAIVSDQAVGGGKENLYNHLQTSINASGNFAVQIDAAVEQAQDWGAAIVVYWDTTHFIVLKAPKNNRFRAEVYDGSTFTTMDSSVTYTGGLATMRIEFANDKVKFYGKNQGDANLTYFSSLDISRDAWNKKPAAFLIIGKGRQNNATYTNPDYNNDYAFAGSADSIVLDNAVYEPLSYDSFEDTFDGPALDPRWTNDNSPGNPSDSEIAIVSGQAVGGGKENFYNHLQASIDTSSNFAVQVDASVDQAQDWGAGLVVYWDTTHFIVLKAPKNNRFRTEVYDGSTFTTTNSLLTYQGGQMATLRIEFHFDKIEFYGKNENDSELSCFSELQLTRPEWTKAPSALLIIGKGRQDNAIYTNPDYNNDYAFAGSTDSIALDNAVYEQFGPQCGEPGTIYLSTDLVRDCYINLYDLAFFADYWLWTKY